jgi:hypothetical protein
MADIEVDDATYAALCAAARQAGLSESELTTLAIRVYVRDIPQEPGSGPALNATDSG